MRGTIRAQVTTTNTGHSCGPEHLEVVNVPNLRTRRLELEIDILDVNLTRISSLILYVNTDLERLDHGLASRPQSCSPSSLASLNLAHT